LLEITLLPNVLFLHQAAFGYPLFQRAVGSLAQLDSTPEYDKYLPLCGTSLSVSVPFSMDSGASE